MNRMTVKELREMFADFDDEQKIYFEIGDSTLEQLSDSYRYSPTLGFPYKDNMGDLIVSIESVYTR